MPPLNAQNPDAHPHWLPYFLVSDCDAATNKARQSAARVCLEPTAVQSVGRLAVLADPQSAVFSLFQFAQEA